MKDARKMAYDPVLVDMKNDLDFLEGLRRIGMSEGKVAPKIKGQVALERRIKAREKVKTPGVLRRHGQGINEMAFNAEAEISDKSLEAFLKSGQGRRFGQKYA